ncbi:PqqD family protein [Brassicibacter mesophilus]|uniref:PqqD family protein n=1 Tax=Brassicibacter mesophilus TaxID=745119 RepID=UPI003D2554A9
MSKKSKDNFLLYIPSRNHDTWKEKNGNIYLIIHHDKLAEKITSWLTKRPTATDVKLDELGTFVWKEIDDRKTVYDIGQCLFKQFGDKCEPIYERLIMYLRYLNKKGWIRFRKEEMMG